MIMIRQLQVIVRFMIILAPILSCKAQAAVILTKNAETSCLGEEVVFTCRLPENVYSLTWSLVVTRDPDIPLLRHVFSYGDYTVDSEKIMVWRRDSAGFYLQLELTSIEPVLVSTLSTNLTEILINAQVTCAQSRNRAQSARITLASKFLTLCPIAIDVCMT